MSRARVLWSDGLFLRPQHFQQLEHSVDARIAAHVPLAGVAGWGLRRCRLDTQALARGSIALQLAVGVMPDGTTFSVPDDDPAPAPLSLPLGSQGLLVWLCLPQARVGVAAQAFQPAGGGGARFAGQVAQRADETAPQGGVVDLLLAHPHLQLALGPRPPDGCTGLALAVVQGVDAQSGIWLDDQHVPPCLSLSAAPPLVASLSALQQQVQQRVEVVAAGLLQPGPGADVRAWLQLQGLNRLAQVLALLQADPELHPQRLHAQLALAAADLSTFSRPRGHRAAGHPPYLHDDPRASLEPLMIDLRDLLSEVLQAQARRLPLQLRAPGLYSALLPGRAGPPGRGLVLAVRALAAADHLHRAVPQQFTLGPADRIRDLVRLHLPAIALQPLPMAPPRLPHTEGTHYFQLDAASTCWPPARADAQPWLLALHVAGDWPGLELALWQLQDEPVAPVPRHADAGV